ncbi:MAG: ATP synthase F0 subunit B [Desulfobacteraceae bacterium]|nr:ATP synthase F0 subunit B [Desulfobacteraceae bacterium]MBC2758064.1 ATP synthase F0 subunit B [Desulfobacteraceae bacterium]
MVSLDSTLIIQIINFLILIWALNTVLYKPIRRILSQRNEKITGLEKNIDQSENDAIEKDLALKSGIKQARENGLREKEALESDGRAEEMKIIEKINEKARADLAEIRARIAQEAEEARLSLLKEVDGFAEDISRRILGRAV